MKGQGECWCMPLSSCHHLPWLGMRGKESLPLSNTCPDWCLHHAELWWRQRVGRMGCAQRPETRLKFSFFSNYMPLGPFLKTLLSSLWFPPRVTISPGDRLQSSSCNSEVLPPRVLSINKYPFYLYNQNWVSIFLCMYVRMDVFTYLLYLRT